MLALAPEELAGTVLQYLLTADSSDLHSGNFVLQHNVEGYPHSRQEEARQALMEAWVWLEREGLIAPRPGQDGRWVFITRRGRQLGSAEKLSAYRHANLLPKEQLHPAISHKVWATFLRGDYDTAVFQGFKELEVAVRKASGLAPTDIGVDLMRKAFKPGTGPLANALLPTAEQEALMHLMAGAVGSYKNPSSHRNVQIEAKESVEMIVLASHLLNIVSRRGAA